MRSRKPGLLNAADLSNYRSWRLAPSSICGLQRRDQHQAAAPPGQIEWGCRLRLRFSNGRQVRNDRFSFQEVQQIVALIARCCDEMRSLRPRDETAVPLGSGWRPRHLRSREGEYPILPRELVLRQRYQQVPTVR
jgi:hypothetical protein